MSRKPRKLHNYLRTHRKRSGFSQKEIAFLLGVQSGARVSRYEHFLQCPTLRAVFAYEVIFRAPAHELFAGVFHEVERDIHKRAYTLIKTLSAAEQDGLTKRKVVMLRALTSGAVTDCSDPC